MKKIILALMATTVMASSAMAGGFVDPSTTGQKLPTNPIWETMIGQHIMWSSDVQSKGFEMVFTKDFWETIGDGVKDASDTLQEVDNDVADDIFSRHLLGEDPATWSPYTIDGDVWDSVFHTIDNVNPPPTHDMKPPQIQSRNFFEKWGDDIKDSAEKFGDFVKSGPDAVKHAGEDVGELFSDDVPDLFDDVDV